jgi:hypothetical protein
VKHEYDEKIESLKSSMRQNEERMRADLTASQSQIESLRSGALAGVVSMRSYLYQKQIEAVETLWDAVVALGPAKMISAQMAIINFEEAAKEAARNEKARELFKMYGQSEIQGIDASKVRPFVSAIAWALFSAYQTIVMHAVLRLKTLQFGFDKDFSDIEGITKIVKVALPHRVTYINQYGISAFHYLLDELESLLLDELKRILDGMEADKESVQRAALILEETMKVNESFGKSNNAEVTPDQMTN